MRALSLTAPQQFDWVQLPEPPSPAPGEALVAIRSIGICGTDIAGYLGKMPFIHYPRILGHELGVEVILTGPGVTQVKPGDRCAVEPYLNCGACHACRQGRSNCCETLSVLGVHVDGGMRETLLLPAHKLHPCNALDYDQLALVETLAIGCHAVHRAAIQPGEDVLIIGAGPIGLTVLQFAHLTQASITVLELNPNRRTFIEQHYPNVHVVAELPDEACAQVVFDATGHPGSMARTLHLARHTGRIVFVGITKEPVLIDDPLFHRRELTLVASRNALSSDFPHILDLILQGKIDTRPWITHRCAFADLPTTFPEWLKPESCVLKAVVQL